MEENKKDNFNIAPLLSVGIVIAMILIGIAAIYAVRVLDRHLTEKRDPETHKNPLFNMSAEEMDDGKPDIPGVTVYHAEKDLDQIQMDTRARETQFRKKLQETDKDKNSVKVRKFLKKKDDFAAERLAFLRKIEAAETKEERLKLIEELKKICEEND